MISGVRKEATKLVMKGNEKLCCQCLKGAFKAHIIY